jgi:hypothetical protein
MLSSRSIATALAIGALAGALFAVWTSVAAALDQAPIAPPGARAQSRMFTPVGP